MSDLSEMKRKAEKIVKELEPSFERLEIAGSIRRGEPHPFDVDLCGIPRNGWRRRIKSNFGVEQMGGKKAIFEHEGESVNLWTATPESFGAVLCWVTGDKGHNIGLCRKAKKRGLKFTQNGLLDRETGELVPTPTERDLAEEIGWGWKPPRMRS